MAKENEETASKEVEERRNRYSDTSKPILREMQNKAAGANLEVNKIVNQHLEGVDIDRVTWDKRADIVQEINKAVQENKGISSDVKEYFKSAEKVVNIERGRAKELEIYKKNAKEYQTKIEKAEGPQKKELENTLEQITADYDKFVDNNRSARDTELKNKESALKATEVERGRTTFPDSSRQIIEQLQKSTKNPEVDKLVKKHLSDPSLTKRDDTDLEMYEKRTKALQNMCKEAAGNDKLSHKDREYFINTNRLIEVEQDRAKDVQTYKENVKIHMENLANAPESEKPKLEASFKEMQAQFDKKLGEYREERSQVIGAMKGGQKQTAPNKETVAQERGSKTEKKSAPALQTGQKQTAPNKETVAQEKDRITFPDGPQQTIKQLKGSKNPIVSELAQKHFKDENLTKEAGSDQKLFDKQAKALQDMCKEAESNKKLSKEEKKYFTHINKITDVEKDQAKGVQTYKKNVKEHMENLANAPESEKPKLEASFKKMQAQFDIQDKKHIDARTKIVRDMKNEYGPKKHESKLDQAKNMAQNMRKTLSTKATTMKHDIKSSAVGKAVAKKFGKDNSKGHSR